MNLSKLNYVTSIEWKTHIRTKYVLGQHQHFSKLGDYSPKKPIPIQITSGRDKEAINISSIVSAFKYNPTVKRAYDVWARRYLMDAGLLEIKI